MDARTTTASNAPHLNHFACAPLGRDRHQIEMSPVSENFDTSLNKTRKTTKKIGQAMQLLNNALPAYRRFLLRGGRMTKVAGRAASYAACMGQKLAALGLSAAVLTTLSIPAWAQAIGEQVLNPDTGESEIIGFVSPDGFVATENGNIILLSLPGDVFVREDGVVFNVVDSRVVNGATVLDLVEAAPADGVPPINDTIAVVTLVAAPPADGDPGNPGGVVPFTPPPGTQNVVNYTATGDSGAKGRNGFGFTPFPGVVVGRSARVGENGDSGPAIIRTFSGDATSSADVDLTPGITVVSRGGNGGDGGDAFLSFNINAAQGGRGGNGGLVDITNERQVATAGEASHGILAQSTAGTAGDGGDNFVTIIGTGGTGGAPSVGGTVVVTNNGQIQVTGDASAGILAQSSGGSGGDGGNGFALVGRAGAASQGGDAGAVTVINQGDITTEGEFGFGINAQSIGGDGGNSGTAVGIVALGGGSDANAGGNGAEVTVVNATDGNILTRGDHAAGISAQSIGGGGGTGGQAFGIVALGGQGAAGGDGSTVTVTTQDGSTITTEGEFSHGVIAHSVGGGGGVGGSAFGLVALGASGSSGGQAGDVTVTNAGQIAVGGENAKGIFAQSIGGGGGASELVGGSVAIGGQGGTGGDGAAVVVSNTGSITTQGADGDGIFAHSVGGGGGSASGALATLAAIGGSGGAGGDGGTVNVSQTGSIQTAGEDASGIHAQSVGGGGGSGGNASSLSAFVGASIGGTGETGGSGGTTTVTLSQSDGALPTIRTSGLNAEGIFAQSIGGGGGDGGLAINATLGAFGGASLAIGGDAAVGGDGGAVNLTGDAAIFTGGQNADGIFAQSIGGGGGAGGATISVALSAGVGGSVGASVAIGGTGGAGGDGGRVDVDSGGTIETQGDFSKGFFAESVGGGGGAGGFAVSIAAAGAVGGGALATAVGIGGTGGDGGDGDAITARFEGDITTNGFDADGALIHSVGGGGGAGGFVVAGAIGAADVAAGAVSVGVGGTGGGGGDGGIVDGEVTGNILTSADQSDGVIIQSVGGGGGAGGFNASGAIAFSGSGSGTVSVGLGGAGGAGGAGDTVTGAVTGDIVTEGAQSRGVLIHSVGGGGGAAGFNASGSISGSSGGAAAVSVGLGGTGGGGGDAGAVAGTVMGNVTTQGEQSTAITIQSEGGGGGVGGFNTGGSVSAASSGAGNVAVGVGGAGGGGGDANTVTANVTANVRTTGDLSGGILAQSTGGGGGDGNFNVTGGVTASGSAGGTVSVGVGGKGGSGGSGGDVTATLTGDVVTEGLSATAVKVESTGGGGGNGGFNVSGALAVTSGGGGLSASIGVGGSGGGGGDGGKVDLAQAGNISTAQDNAKGVFVQSIGGGGGDGGFNVSAAVSVSSQNALTAAVGVGGSGGDGGDANDVTVVQNGTVATAGADANAVLVQSVGGGGGNGGFNLAGSLSFTSQNAVTGAVGIGGFGGGGGDGANVALERSGQVTTTGERATGVTAQSVGGGGGNGGFSVAGAVALSQGAAGSLSFGLGGHGGDGGDAGSTGLTHSGDVTTAADHAHGVVAASVGGGGGIGAVNISGAASLNKDIGGAVGIGAGGFGGGGGDANTVTADISGNIATSGFQSEGVSVLSQGGGGGIGGTNLSGSLAVNKSGGGTVSLGLGGFGGDGGDGADVTATVDGNVTTTGSQSDGVVVQSNGGGGGSGGLNVAGAVTIATGNGSTAGFGLGLGGFGGEGGDSGDVVFSRTGDTETSANGSDGIVVQSVAGGGGNGGVNVSAGVSLGIQGTGIGFALGLGGFGGGGGDAGAVTADIVGDVRAIGTAPDGSAGPVIGDADNRTNGILAQSVGGGGGNGGVNVSAGLSVDRSQNGTDPALVFGVGGFGGDGGNGNTVNLNVTSNEVRTISGDVAIGVGAQSIGGGGGNGGANVSGGVASSGNLTFGLGGLGRDSGIGGDVVANVVADIIAISASDARGFLAQSVGGGGGNGAFNVSGGLTLGTLAGDRDQRTPTLTAGIGGFGGAGNRASSVTAIQAGDISVTSTNAIGVLSQSIGGGGGAGGLNLGANIARTDGVNGAFGLGGFGGEGADGGDVSLTSDGNIFVDGRNIDGAVNAVSGLPAQSAEEALGFGDRATGILAQSIGGGGGDAGMNFVGLVSLKGNPGALSVGGFGGGAGDAGSVTVTRGQTIAGTLVTSGDSAAGLVAQSIGGGGGNAGKSLLVALGRQKPPVADELGTPVNGQFEVLAQLGGDGGSSGIGSDVTVDHTGEIRTTGERSDGLIAQTIGGGGGNAAETIGLGRNAGGNTVNLTVGGGTGDGGESGNVAVTNAGIIDTKGEDSRGIFAQSVGGGGGNTATSMILNLSANNEFGGVLGRDGGDGGNAGRVAVVSDTQIATDGNRSVGVFAQSVGGGGGVSSANNLQVKFGEGGANSTQTTLARSIGRQGGTGGFGGEIDVTKDGLVETLGDNADAILAQSVGGGGGVGGAAFGVIFDQSFGFASAVGGDGGNGNFGGQITVENTATLNTTGFASSGIQAQSVGGGGGIGGYAVGINTQVIDARTSQGFSAIRTVGGNGGTGGRGGSVAVTNDGIIQTLGDESHGIKAESIGGGGGDAGFVINIGASRSVDTRTATLAVGGEGGDGNRGGTVNLTNTGQIRTEGRAASGIYAKSVGGGGGDASFISQLDIAQVDTGASTLRFGASLGASGGTGGTGGNVTVSNSDSARIETQGDDAHGIHALSIGGGGGGGSSIATLNIGAGGSASGERSLLLSAALGGTGGEGNASGNVIVTNDGSITTTGDRADGIRAQSIGGGGGNGGAVVAASVLIGEDAFTLGSRPQTPNFVLGGSGGNGADGGSVTVTNTGFISVSGDAANGVHAQSIGGGGGNATLGLTASTGDLFVSSAIANAVSFALGALQDSSGGIGGDVTVTHTGDIRVSGAGSEGIVAESINGGGGDLVIDFDGIAAGFVDILALGASFVPEAVGFPDIQALPDSFGDEPLVVLISGSSGADAGAAGKVTKNLTGTIVTEGQNSTGVRLQSVNGGGGDTLVLLKTEVPEEGASAIGVQALLGGVDGTDSDGSNVTGTQEGDIGISGKGSIGALVQSVGAGGGRTILALDTAKSGLGQMTAELGAQNSVGGAGGAVDYTQTGLIVTADDLSIGVIAQSVGGGGGVLAMSDIAEPVQAPELGDNAATALALAPLSFSGALGGTGTTGADGGAVSVARIGDIVTSGNGAIGLIAQSVGGGGGLIVLPDNADAQVAFGGANDASGNGGDVVFSNIGNVLMSGAQAHGIIAQSVGGGGGLIVGNTAAQTVTLNDANTGNGGDVALTQTGDVVVTGAQAVAVIAQSIGGGGGFASGFAGTAGGTGNAGAVTLTLAGNIAATGVNGRAILAQSIAHETGQAGDIRVDLLDEQMVMAGLGGTAIALDGGATNSLNNSGTILTLDGTDGMAVTGTTGGDQIANDGLVIGHVALGAGANAFDNRQPTSRFEAGSLVDLGAQENMLRNAGVLALGGSGSTETVETTTLSGSLLQTQTGVSEIDFDFAVTNAGVARIDRVDATGTAVLAGIADLNVVDAGGLTTGLSQTTFVTADGGVNVDDLTLLAPQSAVAEFALVAQGATGAALQANVDFAAGGNLNTNQTELGEYVNRLQVSGGTPDLAPLISQIFAAPSDDELAAIYDTLDAEAYSLGVASVVQWSGDVSGAALGCGGGSAYQIIEGGTCSWGQISGFTASSDGSRENSAFELTRKDIRMGTQSQIDSQLSFGLFAGFGDAQGSIGDTAALNSGPMVQAGGTVKYDYSGAILSGALSLGSASYDVTREIDLPTGIGGPVEGRQRLRFGVLKGRIAQDFKGPMGTVTPSFDVDGVLMHQLAFEETGDSLGALRFDSKTDLNLSVTPAIGFSNSFKSGGTTIIPQAAIGITQRLTDAPSVNAGFSRAPTSIAAFETFAGIGDGTILDLDIGLDLEWDDGAQVLGFDASTQVGKHSQSSQFSISYEMKF